MPIYVYRCVQCNKEFEIISHCFNSDGAKPCPECGSRAERIIAPINWSFGWRLTERSHERFGPRDEYERDV